MDNQNKNLLLATVLSGLVIVGWTVLFPPSPAVDPNAPAETTTSASDQTAGSTALTPGAETPSGTAAGATAPGEMNATQTAEAQAARVTIDTPRISGSISMLGGRLDDVELKDYHVELSDASPLVTLMSPVGSQDPYYALFGWAAGEGVDASAVPGPDTLWQAEDGATLTPDTPVTLTWDNGAGLVFRREYAVDPDYMFTVTQSVENTTDAAVSLRPYGLLRRHGEPSTLQNFFVLHEGLVRMSDGTLQEEKYKKMTEFDTDTREGAPADRVEVTENGWIGFTDHYWMSTLIPQQGQPFRSVAKYYPNADIYQTEAVMPLQEVAPGAIGVSETRLFAGAKETDTIRHYQDDEGVEGFIDSIDWGWFFFLTKPIFAVLHWISVFFEGLGLKGHMGWAIIALTILLKALLFPLAYKSYASMAKMKELQPQMEKLKERAGDDRQKLQKEMMELYKKEKVNPAAGCLPILLQIPIFFSLYKVIFVTIELRHAAWIGWIRDLSAPDPSSILNLFGLLSFTPPGPDSFLHILSLGVLPILLGISMWLQQKLNPAPADKSQAMIFAWMPWVFMFMLGKFASGLVLYWITNNTITFIQQYTIMRSHGFKPDVFGNIKNSMKFGKKDAGKKAGDKK
ncbi:membrane protein insertase YidC [Pseudooceanicola nanhaiensis]|uniref:membrane protein insertase YidC n=1 Tax=Pseudooceanicola nanhaiensis TaxID=375761 RepID=UPI001CD4FF87|nr:membrane protein insertase YidC [Pseudooceanicola nanhaiensis]MCA0922730.1 membrane protein insertase YidC [Pseudooceanicola nanhaiensis]